MTKAETVRHVSASDRTVCNLRLRDIRRAVCAAGGVDREGALAVRAHLGGRSRRLFLRLMAQVHSGVHNLHQTEQNKRHDNEIDDG